MDWFATVIALTGIASALMSFVLSQDLSYAKHERVEFFCTGVVLVFITFIIILTV